MDGDAMAAGLARRLDHRLGRDARRPPAGGFVALCTGLLFARGRRTVASWLRGCARGAIQAYSTCSAASDARPWRSPGSCSASSLSGSGRWAGHAAGLRHRRLAHKRYGPHVEGGGKHHNPTPPAGSPFLYGHVWVCLARLVRHSLWGAIALPILSHLYIRAKDVGWMAAYYGWQFHTKELSKNNLAKSIE